MDAAWTSSDPALLAVAADAGAAVTGSSNRLTAVPAAAGAFAEVVLPAPVDLRGFEELRFWVRADRPAHGTRARPFFLELSYVDDADLPADEHRWFVPVNHAERWEQRRIGIENDRRGAVRRLRLRALGGPFRCHVDDLIAVRDEPIADVERALTDELTAPLAGAPTPVLLTQANPGDVQIVVTPVSPLISAGARLRITGGSAGAEEHEVQSATDAPAQNRTTINLVAGDRVVGTLPAGTTQVALLVPLIVLAPPAALPKTTPALLATHLDAQADPGRSAQGVQRDSFRRRAGRVVCSVRPPARAQVIDYQIVAAGKDRAMQRAAHDQAVSRLARVESLRVNGAPCPLSTIAAPIPTRDLGQRAGVYVRVGTRAEVAARVEQPWIERAHVDAAQVGAEDDREPVVIQL